MNEFYSEKKYELYDKESQTSYKSTDDLACDQAFERENGPAYIRAVKVDAMMVAIEKILAKYPNYLNTNEQD